MMGCYWLVLSDAELKAVEKMLRDWAGWAKRLIACKTGQRMGESGK